MDGFPEAVSWLPESSPRIDSGFTESGSYNPETAYDTEVAIDAVSLWLLHRKSGRNVPRYLYASIGGVSNYTAIDRISDCMHTVPSVDNDPPGEAYRER